MYNVFASSFYLRGTGHVLWKKDKKNNKAGLREKTTNKKASYNYIKKLFWDSTRWTRKWRKLALMSNHCACYIHVQYACDNKHIHVLSVDGFLCRHFKKLLRKNRFITIFLLHLWTYSWLARPLKESTNAELLLYTPCCVVKPAPPQQCILIQVQFEKLSSLGRYTNRRRG